MATAETCPLTDSHPPKPSAVKTFTQLLPTIKKELVHLRHTHDAHEPEYFQAVSTLSDEELVDFGPEDLVAVRAGNVAYGLIVFGKVRIPAKIRIPGAAGQYFFVRWFVGGEEEDDGEVEQEVKFHSFYTEEKEHSNGRKTFRAIMGQNDELFFFNE